MTSADTADSGKYDVVIAGAGIGGCTAAILYGRQGLRVALLEAHRDPGRSSGPAPTSSASAVPTFDGSGLSTAIDSRCGLPHTPAGTASRECCGRHTGLG